MMSSRFGGLGEHRLAQALLAVVVVSTVLPWISGAGAPSYAGIAGSPVRGFQVSVGLVVAFAAALGVLFVQLRWRPAWTLPGFAAAALVREMRAAVAASDVSPGVGQWVALLAALAAAALLIVAMVREIRANASETSASAE